MLMQSKILNGLLLFLSILAVMPVHSAGALSPDHSYPPDPPGDVAWSAPYNGVGDVQAAFNHARAQENNRLGTSIPVLTLPNQSTWNNMNDGEKALWLINRERVDRGILPLQDLEPNVVGVAQYYADYLLDHDAWGHEVDGRSPWDRLAANPAIGACHDSLSVSENLAVFVTSGSSIALPIEQTIYMWMYEDAGSGWGHRHAILWYPYNDNSGASGSEGFLGIGRASGGPYQGPFSQPWNHAEVIVMNVFDPCAAWADIRTLFNDVPPAHVFRQYIEAFYNAGITSGCSTSPMLFCPDSPVTRGQMAVFIERALGNLSPNPSPTDMFNDVFSGDPFKSFIEEFYNTGITYGCITDPLQYCPNQPVTRGQMAVFIERALGNLSPSPSPSGMFIDISSSDPFKPFVEQFYNDGITSGCTTSPLRYCPNTPVTRGQMAVFMVKAFGIPMP